MDSNELKSLADTQFARNTFLNNVNESYKSKLTVVHNGGMFVAKPELISFLNSWHEPELLVEDEYKKPILVTRMVLLDELKTAYRLATVFWATEIQNAERIRRGDNV